MKTKGLQLFKERYLPKLITFCLLLLTLSMALPIGLSAESGQNTFIVENYNYISECTATLSEDMNSYSLMGETVDQEVLSPVIDIISDYKDTLSRLRNHEDVATRYITEEINLVFEKGRALGQLAWIYYYNVAEITNEQSCQELSALYNEYKARVEGVLTSDSAKSESKNVNSWMNRDVFTKKVENLKEAGDTPLITGIIDKAKGVLTYTMCHDTEARELQDIYNQCKTEVLCQRNRDKLNSQLSTIFAEVNPGGSYTDSDICGILNENLKTVTSVSEMNTIMSNAISKLLGTPATDDFYTYSFINEIKSSVREIMSKATRLDKIGEFPPVFSGYNLKNKKAYAKDRIAGIIFNDSDKNNESLKQIEATFNGAGGRVDLCKSQADLEGELTRAEYRKKLWIKLQEVTQSLSVSIGEYDKTSFERQINDAYADGTLDIDRLISSASDYRSQCESILQNTSSAFAEILTEARAERFLRDHSEIIKKPQSDLTAQDETELEIVLYNYIYLESTVKKILASEIKSIVEKYKSVLNSKIRALLPDDAFYQELCEAVCSEINEMKTENIEVFYNNAKLVFKKSQVLHSLTLYYRDITASEYYSSFSKAEKNELSSFCRQASSNLKKINPSTDKSFDTSLSNIAETAKLSLDRVSQYARVRVASNNSRNVNVQQILSQTKSSISSSSSKSEMTSLADNAIFKIQRFLTIDEIEKRAEVAKDNIQEMEFLSEGEKTFYFESIDELSSNLCAQAAAAEKLSVLSFVWENFTENLEKLSSNANSIDLERAKSSYSSAATKSIEAAKIEIRGLSSLGQTRIAEIINSLAAQRDKFNTDSESCKRGKEVKAAYDAMLEELDAIKLSATAENLEGYKKTITAELEKLKDVKNHYSNESYNKIVSIIETAKQSLKSCNSIADSAAVLESAKKQISTVNDLLDDAKSAALTKLNDLLTAAKSKPLLYSADNIEKIAAICQSAAESIKAFSNVEDVEALNAELQKNLALISKVPKDRTYSSKDAYAITDKSAQYPEDYDFSSGYWASISSPGAIPSDATFSVGPASIDKDVQNLIRRAARKNTLKIYGSPTDKQLKLLKKGVVALCIDARLTSTSDEASAYKLQLLLPDELKNENIIGIAFADENGNVEFYNILFGIASSRVISLDREDR